MTGLYEERLTPCSTGAQWWVFSKISDVLAASFEKRGLWTGKSRAGKENPKIPDDAGARSELRAGWYRP